MQRTDARHSTANLLDSTMALTGYMIVSVAVLLLLGYNHRRIFNYGGVKVYIPTRATCQPSLTQQHDDPHTRKGSKGTLVH